MELRELRKAQDYWNEVFSVSNEPKKEIKPGSRYVTLPGWHPTRKSVRGIVRTREPLMADAMIHIDTNPFNLAVAEFPVIVGYRNSRGRYREHVPDLAVRRRDGSVVVIDVMPFYVQRHLGWPERRSLQLMKVFAQLGAHYRLLDERTLHMKPLINNLRLMWRHKHIACQYAWIDEIANEILRLPLPSTIGVAMRSVKQNTLLGRQSDDDEWKVVGEINPAFTAVMQLAIEGKIGIDLRTPFSQSSEITKPRADFGVAPTRELHFVHSA